MNFTTFLSQAIKSDFFCKKPLIYFYGIKNYPLLFFSFLFKQVKKNSSIPVQSVDLFSQNTALITSQLETSFLGQPVLYWCKNLDDLPDKKKKYWLSYFESYTGPNYVALFMADVKRKAGAKNATTVLLSDTLDRSTFLQLLTFFGFSLSTRSNQFVKQLFTKRDVLPLDTACVFMYYTVLTGSNSETFMESWLDKLSIPETSLFTLSQYFFARNSKLFMKLWVRMADEYPHAFWVAFWSDQLWRGYHFAKYSQNRQFAQAKKIGFRLPFSFMQRDWRKSSSKELKGAHDALYTIDNNLKNSAGSGAFDLFFSKYFLKQFTS